MKLIYNFTSKRYNCSFTNINIHATILKPFLHEVNITLLNFTILNADTIYDDDNDDDYKRQPQEAFYWAIRHTHILKSCWDHLTSLGVPLVSREGLLRHNGTQTKRLRNAQQKTSDVRDLESSRLQDSVFEIGKTK